METQAKFVQHGRRESMDFLNRSKVVDNWSVGEEYRQLGGDIDRAQLAVNITNGEPVFSTEIIIA